MHQLSLAYAGKEHIEIALFSLTICVRKCIQVGFDRTVTRSVVNFLIVFCTFYNLLKLQI